MELFMGDVDGLHTYEEFKKRHEKPQGFMSRQDHGGIDAETLRQAYRAMNLENEKRELEAKILTFRQMIKKNTSSSETGMWATACLAQYDRHFGIETLRHGKTEEGQDINNPH